MKKEKLIWLLMIMIILLQGLAGCNSNAEQTEAEAGNNTTMITNLSDLEDKRIGVLTGSAGDHASRQRFPQAQIMDMDNIVNASAALKSNKLDAVVYERSTLQEMVNKNPDLQLLDEPVQLVEVAIAVKKNNTELLNALNEALTEIEETGLMEEMKKRWFTEDEVPAMPEFAALPTQDTLIVGTDALMPPFEFVENNTIIGFDIELIQRIAQKIGKNIVVSNINFSALIPALESGKIDLSISCFNVTEERKQKVDFTKPYFTSEIAAMIRKSGEIASSSNFFSKVKDSFHSNIILENRYLLILNGLKITLIISLFSVFWGTLLGALICFMRMVKNRLSNTIARIYISILRGTPVLVLLMLIYYVAFAPINIDPVIVAIIAFAMNFSAYVSEMFRAAIESIDKGQKEAGIAGGFTPFQTFIYIIMPQAARQVLPIYKGEFISLVKMTSVVGYIAVQDLTKASDIIRSRTFDAFFPLVMVAILYFVISWLLSVALDYILEKTDPKYKRNQNKRNHTSVTNTSVSKEVQSA